MNIAIIAWGSLTWDPKTLKYRRDWSSGGPILPIEFSRISKDGRLTLVIDMHHGVPVETLFATADTYNLEQARHNLMEREGTNPRGVGNIQKGKNPKTTIEQTILEWIEIHGFDAAVWTALGPNFEEKTGDPYSVASALKYLNSLEGEKKANAVEYIEKAPDSVQTPFREMFEKSRRCVD